MNTPAGEAESVGVGRAKSKDPNMKADRKDKMLKEKYYLDPDLNITVFAENIQQHPNKISAILNNIMNQTFRDYVNSYRVNEFKTRLKSIHLSNHTTMSLAFDCGFNSRSSFNRIFKKHVGCTPVEYLKKTQSNMS